MTANRELISILKSITSNIGVSRISFITGYEDFIIHVCQSVRPKALHLTIDSGKGKTKEQAYISCAVEAIERYVAENFTNQIYNIESHNLFPYLQSKADRNCIPKNIRCIKGFNIFTSKELFIPIDLIRFKNNTTCEFLPKMFFSGTTGLCAHSDKTKAIDSGLIEILERDAIADINNKSTLNLNTLPKYFDNYVNWISQNIGNFQIIYHKSSRKVISFSIHASTNEYFGGLNAFGASFDPFIALESVFIEGIQTWIMRLSPSRDDWIFSKRQSYNQELSIKMSVNFANIVNTYTESSNIKDSSIVDSFAKNENIFAVKLSSSISTSPIRVYKVLMLDSKKLDQGGMFTGIPRAIC